MHAQAKHISLVLALLLVVLSSPGFSIPITIMDTYWGGTPTSTQDQDVIGSSWKFSISKMDVDFLGSSIIVDVYTRYLDNVGMYGTGMGDLFLSTSGWSPFGSAPYADDTFSTTGTIWEYGLALDNYNAQSGTLRLYDLTQGVYANNFVFSQDLTSYGFRTDQVVRVNQAALPYTNVGTWAFQNIGGTDTDDFIRFVINQNFGATNYAFRWAMSCANDVIEGAAVAPVPEPSTLLLLGFGLIGLAGYTRYNRRKH